MQVLLLYSSKMLYMFQTGFLSVIRSSKLHIQRQSFVRRSTALGQQQVAVERLTGLNKLTKVASCWLYSENSVTVRNVVCKYKNLSFWFNDWSLIGNLAHDFDAPSRQYTVVTRTLCYRIS